MYMHLFLNGAYNFLLVFEDLKSAFYCNYSLFLKKKPTKSLEFSGEFKQLTTFVPQSSTRILFHGGYYADVTQKKLLIFVSQKNLDVCNPEEKREKMAKALNFR